MINNFIVVDYRKDSLHIIIEFFHDGKIRKTVVNTAGDIVSNFDNKEFFKINSKDLKEFSLPTQLSLNEETILVDSSSSFIQSSSVKTVDPYPYNKDPDCIPFKAKNVYQRNMIYIPELYTKGYYPYTTAKVYSTTDCFQ